MPLLTDGCNIPDTHTSSASDVISRRCLRWAFKDNLSVPTASQNLKTKEINHVKHTRHIIKFSSHGTAKYKWLLVTLTTEANLYHTSSVNVGFAWLQSNPTDCVCMCRLTGKGTQKSLATISELASPNDFSSTPSLRSASGIVMSHSYQEIRRRPTMPETFVCKMHK